jgi:hypothetical protein
MVGHGVGIAQPGCNIFPKTKKAYHHKSPFFTNTFIEVSADALTAYDEDLVNGFTNTYFFPFHIGVAQKIKRRVVIHLAMGYGRVLSYGQFYKESFGAGKIGIDYFFDTSMNGFGVGLYGHGVGYLEEDVVVPMFHLMYAKSSKKYLNQLHLSILPTKEAVVFGAGISIGIKAY